MKQVEFGELGLERVNLLHLRAVRLFERFVFRHRRFALRLPVDLLECLGRELAEENAGDEEIGGNALVDGGVVSEKSERLALILVGKRPACATTVSV